MRSFPVTRDIDVFTARSGARALALEIGFSRIAGQEIAIVVSELCTNILKYAIRGTISVERVDDPDRGPGLRIVASDVGPEIADLALARRDRHDGRGPVDPGTLPGRGGFGGGLGAVDRLSDSCEWSVTDSGKQAVVLRFVRSHGRRRG